ncbi:MAG: hypothetical protein AAGH15_01780 [Myxococcota bacterium]
MAEPARRDPELDWVLEGMPHAPPMRLIGGIVEVDGPRIECTASIGEDHILRAPEREGVSSLVVIELIAQAAAALLVFHARRQGGGATQGFLVGARRLRFAVPELAVGDELRVFAEESFSQGPIAQFVGRIERGGEAIAEGTISVVHAAEPPPA